eukprot:1143723-Pelagomonas_calceolata.AAC.1
MAAMQQAMKMSVRPTGIRAMPKGSAIAPRAVRPAVGRKSMNVSANALPLVGNQAPGELHCRWKHLDACCSQTR